MRHYVRLSQQNHAVSLRGVVLAGTDGQPRYAEMRHGDSVVMLIPKGDATAAIDPSQCDLAEIAWSRFDACFIALQAGRLGSAIEVVVKDKVETDHRRPPALPVSPWNYACSSVLAWPIRNADL